MAGGKRTEKEVKGEVVKDSTNLPKKPTPKSEPVIRPGYKKKATAVAAVAAGTAGLAYMASDKKEDKKIDASYSKGEKPTAASIKQKSEPKKGISEFGAAFKEARKKRIASGESEDTATFTYKGKKYHTRTKEDEAKKKAKK
jgi:hypothetical protein